MTPSHTTGGIIREEISEPVPYLVSHTGPRPVVGPRLIVGCTGAAARDARTVRQGSSVESPGVTSFVFQSLRVTVVRHAACSIAQQCVPVGDYGSSGTELYTVFPGER